ncbi:MAG: restriction endonuclease subunit S [Algibacter sp.]|uniref:restriction endonuclease subunit S n=1 Tax=Algibacter sp. TaxID=1872428 RepID=UPI0026093241|nr:restriction endonuclease subunit S [Algibacter sp.]MDG1728971.1 restriction endonuclease subunit S [Algibacter sp.]MDG2177209.1 restriction endonuclease subunit S [Algibacter sp.]
MIQKLANIAEIQFGSYDKPQETGSIKYLHAGHFDKLYKPTKFEESFIELDGKNDKFLLQPNDVILAGKGHRTFAWAYNPDFGKAIPSSLFYIIRTKPSKVLGTYLAQYLNSEKIQYNLKLIGAGATITSIPKRELEEVSVDIPSLEEQKKIVDFIELLDEDLRLTQDLLEKRTALKQGIINKLMSKKILMS